MTLIAEIVGRNHWGMQAKVTLRRVETPGVWWRCGDASVSLDTLKMGCFSLLFRSLYVRDRNRRVLIPEHLFGVLHLLRASGVEIEVGKNGLPYENGGVLHWDSLESVLEQNRDMPVYTVSEKVSFLEGRKTLTWTPGSEPLNISVSVQYPKTERITVRVSLESNDDLRRIATARSMGRLWLWPYARWHGVVDQHVWLRRARTEEGLRAVLKELALHRALDLLGAIEYLRPAGAQLGGSIETAFAGHPTDMQLVGRVANEQLLVHANSSG